MEPVKQAFKVLNIQKEISKRYNPYENKDNHYVKFGEQNDFPDRLIWLSNHSSMHRTCLEAIIDAIFGEGLTSDKPELLDKANFENETWNDIFQKVATDFKTFGYFSLEVIWSKDRSKISEVYHIDASYIRAKEKNHRGKIPGYFISSEWGKKLRYMDTVTLEDDQYLPVFNPNNKLEEPNQIYVYNPYKPGQKYYSVPDYIGALKVIELDTEIDNFHVNNIKNGLAPSLAITTFTNADEDQRNAIETMLRLQLAGSDQAGQMLYMDVDSPENAPIITPINQNGADGYYTTINDLVTQKILTAHRITSPEIFGIMTPGKLGGKEEVQNAYLLFLNTVVKPMQEEILTCLEYLLQFQNPGTDFILGIQQTKLYEDGSTEVDVVTSTEAENEDTQILEDEINNQ